MKERSSIKNKINFIKISFLLLKQAIIFVLLNNREYLNRLFESDKPLIVYKTKAGYCIYTDFSDKIFINKSNIDTLIKKALLTKKIKNNLFRGYIGFFGYKTCCDFIGIKIPKQKNNNFPKSIFYKPETIIKFNKNIFIKSTLKNFKNLKDLKRRKNNFYYNKKFKVNLNLNQYTNLFNKFSKKIKKGETYQIKICQKYRNQSKIDSIKFFWKLMKANCSPESFLIRDKNFSVISCSPETLIEKRNKKICTMPIAGTLKKNLRTSLSSAKIFFKNNEKESKEHNMIIDMERNDLSRICKTGSVKISKLKFVEEYKDLYHYVSKIEGTLKDSVKIIDIIKAMMPGGSVIGCPKINTLNLLNNQERENRNIYTGSFGYIKFNGDMRFNIIIRSILNFKNISEISVASGVVVDSNAQHEFNENYIKAKALIDLFK